MIVGGSSGTRPVRVAVIGSGPAGFYTVGHLLDATDVAVSIDIFERLPTPYGLVRFGVHPARQQVKRVTDVYARFAAAPACRFLGNVEYGRDISIEDLREHYHQIVVTTGAAADRRLDIPGESLDGCHGAAEFIAWYNGHPDFAGLRVDLSHPTAVIVGIGNVALDAARILCSTPDELRVTDIADHALGVLEASRVRQVVVLGRRDPSRAACSAAELTALAGLADADVRTLPGDLAKVPRESRDADATTIRKLEILRGLARPGDAAKSRTLLLRFLVSPTEILGNAQGRVSGVRLVTNELVAAPQGRFDVRPTREETSLDAGLVLRAIGYRGVPLEGLPFDDARGVIPNVDGRIVEPETGSTVAGTYVAGWIKRGPTGVIGTNRADARETVDAMLDDIRHHRLPTPSEPDPSAVDRLLARRGIRAVSFDEWQEIDRLERASGLAHGRPRVKFTSREEIFDALDILEPPGE